MPEHLHLVDGSARHFDSSWPEVPITVVLADGHALLRRNLCALVDAEDDLQIVGEAADLTALAAHLRERRADVLVLDLDLVQRRSLGQAIQTLREQAPETEIVALTMEPTALLARLSLDAGALGFVLADRADTELPAAVRLAAVGREYVSPHVTPGLEAFREAVSHGGLTARETEVLRLIALGHTSAEIAVTLHLSRRTVETHRAHIFHKLQARTRAELVRHALNTHLIGPGS